MSHPALNAVAHRPWPLPAEPWVWRQTWNDLAFLHWPIDAARLQPLVPRGLSLEQFDGKAWVAVTPFWMSGVTLRGVPPLPALSTFPELNVRTYVRHGDRPGIWFFSLDAANRLAVIAAQMLFLLNYVHARMKIVHKGNGRGIDYFSKRSSGAVFLASYEPTGAVQHTQPGTLEHFLTERYCLYAQSSDGQLHRAEIHHAPWPLQPARADIRHNDMLEVNRISVEGEPVVHYAARLDVIIWPLRVVR